MLDAVPGAHPAVVARRPPAVLDPARRPAPPASRPTGSRACSPAVRWSHGRTSSLGRGGGGRTSRATGPRPPSPPSQRSRSKYSPHSWNVPPARHTRSITRPMRRSPRLAMPSATVAAGSCHLRLTLRALCVARAHAARSCAAARRRCSGRTTGTACAAWARSRRGSTVTDARSVWRRPIATQLRASSAMPSVSSSVSVGRPVRKYSFIRDQPWRRPTRRRRRGRPR